MIEGMNSAAEALQREQQNLRLMSTPSASTKTTKDQMNRTRIVMMHTISDKENGTSVSVSLGCAT
jgi:hypothetical protein